MKKIYFFASAIFLAGSLSAQKKSAELDARPISGSPDFSFNSNKSEVLTKKTPGDVLWNEDFVNGVLGNTTSGAWTAISTSGSTKWEKSTSGSTIPFGGVPLNSATAANGYMLYDIGAVAVDDGASAYLESPAIDISNGAGLFTGTNALGFEFDHNLATCCAYANYPAEIFVGYNDGDDFVWTSKNSGNTDHNNFFDGDVETRLITFPNIARKALETATAVDKNLITINNYGTGYTAATYTSIALTGGSGTGAMATVIVSDDAITASTLTNAGTGFTDGTYNSVSLTGGAGAGATADVTVLGGIVTGYTLTNRGSGYAATDMLSITDVNLGGTGGTAVEITVNTIASGIVTSVTITDPGTGYVNGEQLSADNTTIGNGTGFILDGLTVVGISEVKIRYHWNPTGATGGYVYYWMIDDVKVIELEGTDAALEEVYIGDIFFDFDPYIIPQSQAHDMIIGGNVVNTGGNDLTDVTMSVNITGASLFTGSATAFALASGTDTTFNGNSSAISDGNTPASPTVDVSAVYYNTKKSDWSIGVHTAEVSITATGDAISANNTISRNFEYSEFEYGHYNPSSSDADLALVNDDANTGTYYIAYPIKSDGIVYGIYLDIEDGNTANTAEQTFTVGLQDADGNILASQDQVLKDDMINTGRTSVKFDNAAEVFGGTTVYAYVTAYGAGSNLIIKADWDGDSDFSTSVEYGGTTYGTSTDPYINLSFDPNLPDNWVSVKENIANGLTLAQNTPNPANNTTRIDYSIANADNVTIEVVDITGKVVSTVNEGTKSAGDYSIELNTSDFSNGIYFYTLTVGQNKLTNRMIVNK